MRLGYTQQSLGKVALCQEIPYVKPRCFAVAFLSVLFVFCISVRVFAGPDAPKQFDAKLFQELRWRLIGPPRGGRVLAVTGVRGQPEVFYFGSVGGGVWKTDDAGRTWNPIFRSKDGGKSWQKILFHDENTGAIDLAFEPGNPKMIYASLWQTRRPPWSIYAPSYGPGSGLYRSNDGGGHWEHVSGQGLPSEGLGRIGIAFAPSNPRRIYLIVDRSEESRVGKECRSRWSPYH